MQDILVDIKVFAWHYSENNLHGDPSQYLELNLSSRFGIFFRGTFQLILNYQKNM